MTHVHEVGRPHRRGGGVLIGDTYPLQIQVGVVSLDVHIVVGNGAGLGLHGNDEGVEPVMEIRHENGAAVVGHPRHILIGSAHCGPLRDGDQGGAQIMVMGGVGKDLNSVRGKAHMVELVEPAVLHLCAARSIQVTELTAVVAVFVGGRVTQSAPIQQRVDGRQPVIHNVVLLLIAGLPDPHVDGDNVVILVLADRGQVDIGTVVALVRTLHILFDPVAVFTDLDGDLVLLHLRLDLLVHLVLQGAAGGDLLTVLLEVGRPLTGQVRMDNVVVLLRTLPGIGLDREVGDGRVIGINVDGVVQNGRIIGRVEGQPRRRGRNVCSVVRRQIVKLHRDGDQLDLHPVGLDLTARQNVDVQQVVVILVVQAVDALPQTEGVGLDPVIRLGHGIAVLILPLQQSVGGIGVIIEEVLRPP